MGNEVAKIGDGFDGYEGGTEGQERGGGGIIIGQIIKFTNEAAFVLPDGDEIDPKREFVADNIVRVVQRWHDGKPVETIVIAPHQKFPDVAKMNDAVPREEWLEGPDGHPRGPWQAQHVLHLRDAVTMDCFSFPTGTVGGSIAMRDLTDKVTWMRRYRGPGIFAVVCLRDVFMNTRFGGRQRPHFEVQRWMPFGGGDGGEPLAIADKTIDVPSAKEVTGDEVRF
jgi:hypothetical protein